MLIPSRLYIVSFIIRLIPETRFWGLKRILYRFCGAKVGKRVHICSSVKIIGNNELTISDGVWLSPGSYISATAPISIGELCDIGPQCYIGTGTHEILVDENKAAGIGISMPISIGRGCWIGARTIILPGIHIGECSISAAGAIVCKSQPSRVLVAGVPAKIIKFLK